MTTNHKRCRGSGHCHLFSTAGLTWLHSSHTRDLLQGNISDFAILVGIVDQCACVYILIVIVQIRKVKSAAKKVSAEREVSIFAWTMERFPIMDSRFLSLAFFHTLTYFWHLHIMICTEWRDQKMSSRPIPRLFFETKYFRDRYQDFFPRPDVFDTDTETFFETKCFRDWYWDFF